MSNPIDFLTVAQSTSINENLTKTQPTSIGAIPLITKVAERLEINNHRGNERVIFFSIIIQDIGEYSCQFHRK